MGPNSLRESKEAYANARFWQREIRRAWRTRHIHGRRYLRHAIRQYKLWCERI